MSDHNKNEMNTRDHPGEEECLRILADYGTPAHVIGHCREVARVACALGEALNGIGYDLDIDLVRAAGMLHDMARTEEEHWNVAADWCLANGLPGEAEIIRQHMFYPEFSPLAELNETDLVCLGDRLVKDDRYVGLDERMEYIIQKAIRAHAEDHIPVILANKRKTALLLAEMEEKLGRAIDEILQ